MLSDIIVDTGRLSLRALTRPARLLAILLLAASPGLADWQSLGPFGGDFLAAAVDSADTNRIVAIEGGQAQVFESADGGQSWIQVGQLPAAPLHDAGAYDAERWFALQGELAFHSVDGGRTWASAAVPAAAGTALVIAPHPSDPARVYAAGRKAISSTSCLFAFFTSTDGGASWSGTTPLAFQDFMPYDMAVTASNPAHIYVCGYKQTSYTRYAALFRSIDGGASWTDVSLQVDATPYRTLYSVCVDPADAQRVYAGGSFAYRSVDGGSTWSYTSVGPDALLAALSLSAGSPNRLLAGGVGSVFISTDYGETWSERPGALRGQANAIAIAAADPSQVLIGTSQGLSVSHDAGDTWSDADTGIANSTVPALCVAPSQPERLFIAHWDVGVLRSDDRGQSWLQKAPFGNAGATAALAVHPDNADVVLALAGGAGSDDIQRSANAGASWTEVDNHLSDGYALCWDPAQPAHVYAAGRYGYSFAVTASTNGGLDWPVRMHLGPASPGSRCRDLAVRAGSPSTVYAAGSEASAGVVYRSTHPETWVECTANLGVLQGGASPWSVAAVSPGPSNLLFAGTEQGVFRYSPDAGAWQATALGESVLDMLYAPGVGMLYAATEQGSLYASSDAGGSWSPQTNGLAAGPCLALGLDAGNALLYAGTEGGGAWRMPLATTNGTPVWWLAANGWTQQLDQAAAGDQDGDGLTTSDEYLADTSPTNAASFLRLTGLTSTGGGFVIEWQGGVEAVQALECVSDPGAPGVTWTPLFTNLPPTSVEENFFHPTPLPQRFYRIRTWR